MFNGTRLHAPKNEEIAIPNCFLLDSNIINFTRKEKPKNLILHTTVDIGYETLWRHLDAMLKAAT